MKLLIKNGAIVDGSGADVFRSDLLVEDGKIVQISESITDFDCETLDASGMWISPGFIDCHSHSDEAVAKGYTDYHRLVQGITTQVTGNCGMGNFACETNMMKKYCELAKGQLYNNHVPLVAHSDLREKVMDDPILVATDAEVEAMCNILDEQMRSGAWGFSTGLQYSPGKYASFDEIERLCQVVSRHKGIYTTHMRCESVGTKDSVYETIEIAKRTGVRVQISHIKVMGEERFGSSPEIIKIIEDARLGGVDIWADCYPYDYSMTTLSVLLPDIEESIKVRGGAEKIILHKTLAEISKERNLSEVDTVKELLREDIDIEAFYSSMCEEDMINFMQCDWVSIGSDGLCRGEHDKFVHPRSFGTFPRVIGKYAREKKIFSMPEAIRKMTSQPAEVYRIPNRGLIKVGNFADLVIFDPNKIIDTATFEEPLKYPEGISHVLVNGEFIIKNNRLTKNRVGEVLLN